MSPRVIGPPAILPAAPLLVACALLLPVPVSAQTVDETLWGVDGRVLAVSREGDRIYIGGNFSLVGPRTGGGVPLSIRTGAPAGPFPKVTGFVYAVTGDGAGGWYIGGDFLRVGGTRRSRIAHILPDGTLSDWSPVVNGTVLSLLRNGPTLYAAGAFDRVDDAPRRSLAAFDLNTGQLKAWNPMPNRAARTLLAGGRSVFTGGDFDSVGGQPTGALVELDPSTGAVRADFGVIGVVHALARHGSTLYLGGTFGTVTGQPRRHLAAIDLAVGSVTPWQPKVDPPRDWHAGPPWVASIAVGSDVVYIAGHFDAIGGRIRSGVAAIDAATGEVTDWDPSGATWYYAPSHSVIAVRGHDVYIGGRFGWMGGQRRPSLACVDARTGRATAWDPRMSEDVLCLAFSGDRIYAGGRFMVAGGEYRRHLAALDARTGAVTDWDPQPNELVTGLAVHEGSVFTAGWFQWIGGEQREYLAAVDAVTGRAMPWNPAPGGRVHALAAGARALYVSGEFSAVGGERRVAVAALDYQTGHATPWNPDPDGSVRCLAARDSIVYVAGEFTRIGGQPRASVAALSAATGMASGWIPARGGAVYSMAISPSTVYVGGFFNNEDGTSAHLLGLDAVSGAVTWQPAMEHGDVSGIYVNALGVQDRWLYIGGRFGSIQGRPRVNLAIVDLQTGLPTEWDGDLGEGNVWEILVDGKIAYIGGSFYRIDGVPGANFAALTSAEQLAGKPRPARVDAASQSWSSPLHVRALPNPSRGRIVVEFTLPVAGPVTLMVYDVHGRRLETPLVRVLRPAGDQRIEIRTEQWPAGVYLYRLEAAGHVATGRILLLE